MLPFYLIESLFIATMPLSMKTVGIVFTLALLVSVLGGLFMAALGLGFALLTDSDAVLLDGVFSLIGTAVALHRIIGLGARD